MGGGRGREGEWAVGGCVVCVGGPGGGGAGGLDAGAEKGGGGAFRPCNKGK